MPETAKPADRGHGQAGFKRGIDGVKNCLKPTISPSKKQPIPRLNPLIRIGLQRYLSEIESAPFIDRQINLVLPELIIELLRIDGEVSRV